MNIIYMFYCLYVCKGLYVKVDVKQQDIKCISIIAADSPLSPFKPFDHGIVEI